jgi:hypothetical protein
MSIRKTVVFAASALLAAGALVVTGIAQDKPAEKKPTAREVYKNLKVLPKDLPADQVIPIMHRINDSLGVKCDFCHVVETTADGKHVGWEKDDKKMKGVARDMIKMTTEMNKRFKAIDKKATCFMCHRGRPEPVNAPPAGRP